MDPFLELCYELCQDEKSRAVLGEVSVFFPEEICMRICNEFCTRTLSQKIHPVQEDDIYMASHRTYRKFARRERNVVGKAINEATLGVLQRICGFLHKNNKNKIDRENNLELIVQHYLGFPPSRQFMSMANRSHQETPSLPSILTSQH